MKTLGNFVWFVFCGGLLSAVVWILLGALMAVTVVGLPFAYAAFRIARFAAFPFGKELVDAQALGEKRIPGTALANVVWFLLAGIWLAIAHVLLAIECIASCVLVVPILLGAPAWAIAHIRLAGVSLAPLGKRVVPSGMASEVRRRQINAKLDAAGV
ncbi:MAG TPA: YccF domain-containing protein [Phycisphaerae bacterium]|nr:YccF domain-containing protein [Phycisphaerae bacterium]